LIHDESSIKQLAIHFIEKAESRIEELEAENKELKRLLSLALMGVRIDEMPEGILPISRDEKKPKGSSGEN